MRWQSRQSGRRAKELARLPRFATHDPGFHDRGRAGSSGGNDFAFSPVIPVGRTATAVDRGEASRIKRIPAAGWADMARGRGHEVVWVRPRESVVNIPAA
jgi:hypothetical protein